jgi:hypothetical protein
VTYPIGPRDRDWRAPRGRRSGEGRDEAAESVVPAALVACAILGDALSLVLEVQPGAVAVALELQVHDAEGAVLVRMP